MASRVPAEDRPTARRALVGCQRSEARRLVTAALKQPEGASAECRAAVPLLEDLDGEVSGADERWRSEQLAWCRPRATPFPTHTALQQAAYELFRAAGEAARAGKLDLASERYGKARAMDDNPVVRRTHAMLEARRGDCAAAAALLEPVPGAHRTRTDLNLLAACGPYRSRQPLRAEAFDAHLELLASASRLRERGDLADAREAWLQIAERSGSPAAHAHAVDLLFDLDQCAPYLERVSAVPPAVRELLTDLTSRQEHCAAPLGAASSAASVLRDQGHANEATPEPASTPDASLATSAAATGRKTHVWPWLVGGAAAIAGGIAAALLLAPEPLPAAHKTTDIP